MPRNPSAAAAHIGAGISAKRNHFRLTQDDLASLTGIDSANIRGYESGRSMLSIHTLVRIAEALKTHPGKFIDGLTPEMFVITSAAERRTG